MFDKLDDLLIRFEEVLNELGEPDVTSNPDRFKKLMKEQSDLQQLWIPIRNIRKIKKPFRTAFPCWKRRKMRI